MPRAKTAHVRGKPRGIRHDRDCQNCKNRGVKCDLNRPRCLPCTQSGLACGGWPQRVVWASERTRSTDIFVSNASHGTGVHGTSRLQEVSPGRTIPTTSSEPDSLTRGSNQSDTSSKLSAVPDESSRSPDGPVISNDEQYSLAHRLLTFCRNIKPVERSIGDDHDALPHTVSADSANQLVSRIDEFLQSRIKTYASTSFEPLPSVSSSLGDRQPLPPEQDRRDTSELHRLAALASLSEALDTADPVAFVGIAVFAFFEVVSDAAFGEWQTHLRGARSLLDCHCRSREELEQLSRRVNGLAEILAYFTWWDVIGINIRRLSGRHSSQDDKPIFLPWHRSVLGEEFFGTVGCPKETFEIFESLADNASDLGEDTIEDRAGAETSRHIQAMGQLLRLGSDNTDQGKCGDAWRCAAAVAVLAWRKSPHALDTLASQDYRQATLDAAVERICELIASASPSSRFYIHMATPAFFAGINTRLIRHCEVLRKYWLGCRIGEHPRYWGAYTECEERWKRKELF